MISIALNPFIFKLIKPVHKWIKSCPGLVNLFERAKDPLSDLPLTSKEALEKHVVLVGYGRVAGVLRRYFLKKMIPFVIIEENREIIHSLRATNFSAIYGNAAHPYVLVQAHMDRASMIIVGIPDTVDIRNIVQYATQLNQKSSSSFVQMMRKKPYY